MKTIFKFTVLTVVIIAAVMIFGSFRKKHDVPNYGRSVFAYFEFDTGGAI